MTKRWAKSTNGPDEIDVMAMMKAIAAVHDGRVELRVRSEGTGFTPSVVTTWKASFDVLAGSRLPVEVVVENPYPCADHPTLMAHLYDGLYRLDAAIQRAYENLPLTE